VIFAGNPENQEGQSFSMAELLMADKSHRLGIGAPVASLFLVAAIKAIRSPL